MGIDVGVRTGDPTAGFNAAVATFASSAITAGVFYAGLGVVGSVAPGLVDTAKTALSVVGLASGTYGVVEAGRNGMYATAVVGAILLAVAAYSLLSGGEQSGEPKAGKDSKKGLEGQQFADSREGLVLSDASGAGSGDRVPLRAYSQGRDTVIEHSDGTVEIRSGGSVSWRNNNPGNLRNYPFSQRRGSIGEAHGFAVFPNEDTGQRAMLELLKTPKNQARTLADAITNWDNPQAPNLEYVANVSKWTGIAPTTPLWTLSDSQFESLAAAIRRMEGWRVGRVNYVYAP